MLEKNIISFSLYFCEKIKRKHKRELAKIALLVSTILSSLIFEDCLFTFLLTFYKPISALKILLNWKIRKLQIIFQETKILEEGILIDSSSVVNHQAEPFSKQRFLTPII